MQKQAVRKNKLTKKNRTSHQQFISFDSSYRIDI